MTKSRIFIGSSVEHLDVAYAAQENLEHFCEVTVWDQGIFGLSRYTLDALMNVLEETDFGLFVFSPDDVSVIRNEENRIVRDNVIFELGLFIGRIGRERTFILLPRGIEDFHLPSDLLGLTPGTYEPNRQDGRLPAALGPACNKMRRAIAQMGPLKKVEDLIEKKIMAENHYVTGEQDCIILMEQFWGSKNASDSTTPIRYLDVDKELNLMPGMARRFLEISARKWHLLPDRVGEEFIKFKYEDEYRRKMSEKGVRMK